MRAFWALESIMGPEFTILGKIAFWVQSMLTMAMSRPTIAALAGLLGVATWLGWVQFAATWDGSWRALEPAREVQAEATATHLSGDRQVQTRATGRQSLGVAKPAEGAKTAELPPTAIILQLLRWPDLAALGEQQVQVVDSRRGFVKRLTSQPHGRLRLPDGKAEELGPIYLRADGFEALRVEGQPHKQGFKYTAILRPNTGWYGRVVDHQGRPAADVAVAGFWVEDTRPITSIPKDSLLGSSVSSRLAGDAPSDPSAVNRQRNRESLRRMRGISQEILARETVAFLATHAEVQATSTTNKEGWYYVPPLDGHVIGNLTLLAQSSEFSSSVVRVALPSAGPVLPRIVLHPARHITARTRDQTGAPVAGVRVIHRLAGGWAPESQPVITDSEGIATLLVPTANVWVAAEKVGLTLAQVDEWQPASADGMLKDIGAIAPTRSSPSQLYRSAYSSWKTVLPRARGFRSVEPFASDVMLQLEPLGWLEFEVLDAASRFPLTNAAIHVRYGGLAPERALTKVGFDGKGTVTLSDREWQPMVVTISAPGYRRETLAIAPSPPPASGTEGQRSRLVLLREGVPKDASGSNSSAPNGLLLGPDGPLAASIKMHTSVPKARRDSVLFEGKSDAAGEFRYSLDEEVTPIQIFAVALDPASGLAVAGLASETVDHVVGSVQNPAVILLERTLNLNIALDHLELRRPYRLEWSLHPPRYPKAMAQGRVAIPADHDGRSDLVMPVPRNWTLRCRLLGAVQGHGPKLAFAAEQEAEPLFLSTRPTWEAWDPVTEFREQLVTHEGRSLYIRVQRRVDLSGVVTNLARYPDPNEVSVAAIGPVGTWYSTVTGNGWFQFQQIPIGNYKIVLYERPNSTEAGVPLQSQGDVRGVLALAVDGDDHSLELEWKQAEDSQDASQSEEN